MEFLLTKIPDGRFGAPRSERIESNISVRQGRSLEKAAGPQKPATSFMAPIRNFLRSLFCRRAKIVECSEPASPAPASPTVERSEPASPAPASPATVRIKIPRMPTERELIGCPAESRLRIVTNINPASPDIPENEADVESDSNFLRGVQTELNTQHFREQLPGALAEKSARKTDWMNLLSAGSRRQLEKVARDTEWRRQTSDLLFSFNDFRAPAAANALAAIVQGDQPESRLSKEDCDKFTDMRLEAFEKAIDKLEAKFRAATGTENQPSDSIGLFRQRYSEYFDGCLAALSRQEASRHDLRDFHLRAMHHGVQAAVHQGIDTQEIPYNNKGKFMQALRLACYDINAEIARNEDPAATASRS